MPYQPQPCALILQGMTIPGGRSDRSKSESSLCHVRAPIARCTTSVRSMSRVLRNADQRLGFAAISTGGSADQSTTSCGLEGISKSQTLRTGIGLREDSAMRHPIWSHVPLSRSPLPWVQKALDFILISFPMKLAVFGLVPAVRPSP
jgi:hypothetical protein